MVAIKVIYGTEWCGDCKRSKVFLDENNVPYNWVDVDSNKEAKEDMKKANGGRVNVPTIIFDDGTVLVEPSNKQLATKLNIDY